MTLSHLTIQTAKPKAKSYKMSGEKGLFLLVTPKGQKWWRLKYRFDGKEKSLSLGVYPQVSLKEANDRRDKARDLLAEGVDPSASRKAKKEGNVQETTNTFEAVAREWLGRQSNIGRTSGPNHIVDRRKQG